MTEGLSYHGVMWQASPSVGSELGLHPKFEALRSQVLVGAPRAVLTRLESDFVNVAEPRTHTKGVDGAVGKSVVLNSFVYQDAHFDHPPLVRFLLLDSVVSPILCDSASQIVMTTV